MSNMAFWMAKAPMAQDTRIIGAIAEKGTRSTAAKSGTVVSTITSPDYIAEIHRGDQAPDEILVLDEHQRTGIEPPDHQAAEQDRRRAGAGNAERQHRQQRRGAGGMRRGFRREHPLDAAGAEDLGSRAEAFGQVVAHEGRRDGSARRHAEPEPMTEERSSVAQ